jgi:hypothetical protein
MHYGFQRLVLLNSAGYQRAEMPLDDSVSLIAPNNMGKTSLINALQFLLIINRRRMDFGAHDFDKSRRFYFPNNSAYILLEATLPDTGTVVLGCVGKGVSYDYDYFAYKGQLNIDEYRCDNGMLVTQPNLIRHLAERGRQVFAYSSSEFTDIIYGGRKKRTTHEPDFTLFRLEQASDAPAFQSVLTRTLRLDKLKSADVKAYLLQIFKRELPDATIDFKQEWEKAFAEVNAEREQYLTTKRLEPTIAELESRIDERLVLRGKLCVWRPLIENALLEWQQFYTQTRTDLEARNEQLQVESSQLIQRDREWTLQAEALKQQLAQLDTTDQLQAELTQRFALIHHAEQLEASLITARHKLDEHTALVMQGSSRSVQAIQRDLTDAIQKREQLVQQQKTLTDNLWRQLRETLPADASEPLERLLSADALTLGPDHFRLNSAELLSFLQQQSEAEIALPGLTLSLSSLTLQYQALSAAELTERIQELQNQEQSLHQQLEVASALDQARQRKQALENSVRQIEADLIDYTRLLQLQSETATRAKQRETFETQRAEIVAQLGQSEATANRLRTQRDEVDSQIRRLDEQHKEIDRHRHQRLDQSEQFNWLGDLPHHPWVGKAELPMIDLARRLAEYQQDCRRLLDLDHQLSTGLSGLHSAGLTKYQFLDNSEEELRRIIDFSHHLPREAEALEKKARSAVVNVTASLRELRGGLRVFIQRMREFNKLIDTQRLSDLKTFQISPQEETHLVAAIDLLINTAEQVESGESYNLFNQNSVMDDKEIDKAKQILISEGSARQGLKVADLFRLHFIVAKRDGQAESFEDLDSAASNGTVLMAKLVTGLAMLHLMQDKRQRVRAVCYLDEALALDANNQKSLIATSEKFGFALIFASPAPLVTVRYCVPIHHQNGYNHISRQSWQILEPLEPSPDDPTQSAL